MTPLEVIVAKRAHLARLANQSGAAGEQDGNGTLGTPSKGGNPSHPD
jgi:hypothetical protein